MAAQPPQPQILIAEPSVKSLLIQLRSNGQALGTGTAFVANAPSGPVLITNRHNVTGRHPETGQPLSNTGAVPDEIAIFHNRANLLGQWVSRVEPLHRNGQPLWVEHPTLGARADFVALRLTQLNDVQLYLASEILRFLLPRRKSSASSVFRATDPAIDFGNLPVFLIDCRSRQGQSGSAVIAHRTGGAVATEQGVMLGGGEMTRFLGIYSGRINAESDLGFVWKAAAIQQLVASVL